MLKISAKEWFQGIECSLEGCSNKDLLRWQLGSFLCLCLDAFHVFTYRIHFRLGLSSGFFLSSWSLGRISPDDGKGKMFLFVTICVCVWLLVWFYFFLFFPCWVKGELGIGGEEIAPFLGCCTSLGTSSVPRCPICAEPCCWLISSLERAWTGFNVIP